MLIETHCHLEYLKAQPLEELRLQARQAGITKIITIGVDPENLDKVFEMAKSCEEVYFTQGIHPHDSKLAGEIEYGKITSRASHPKMVAVGEIGLDYHYNNSSPEIQRKVFEEQLELACLSKLPVVIHTRDADEDTKSILRNFLPKLNKRGVLHSFTSGQALAEWALSEGFYLGFNGIITFKKAEAVQAIVNLTPTNQILFETDSPFLTPVPHRGKENAPHYLPFIAEKVAELKSMNVQELKKIVYENSINCFSKLANS